MLPDFMTRHPGQPTIPDPYYGDIADFDFALDLIEDACEGLFAYLCANNHWKSSFSCMFLQNMA
jgi:protein-tyrosine phosphatase